MDFGIESEQLEGDLVVLRLTGEIDLYTAPEFKHELLRLIEAGARRVVLDFTDTTFVDSTALGVLLSGLKRLKPNDGHLLVVITNRNLRRIFEVTGLDRIIPIHETPAAALEEVGA